MTDSSLTFDRIREANTTRCLKWHPKRGVYDWSPSDWMTAIAGELGELAGLIKMRNRERDGLPGNKFSPSKEQIAKEMADVFIYLDLLAAYYDTDLGQAIFDKFNETLKRVNNIPLTSDTLLTFDQIRKVNTTRGLKWHPDGGTYDWSPSDWITH